VTIRVNQRPYFSLFTSSPSSFPHVRIIAVKVAFGVAFAFRPKAPCNDAQQYNAAYDKADDYKRKIIIDVRHIG